MFLNRLRTHDSYNPIQEAFYQVALRRTDWPLTSSQLRTVISLGETTLVELKREWWAPNKEGRAKLARQLMALANAVGPEELSVLIFGVEDERHGSRIVAVQNAPDPESIAQLVEKYVSPVPKIECRHYQLTEGIISAVAILHAPTRPHFCIRDYPGILSTNEVYIRRDKQVGIMTPPELEQMVREKDRVLGPRTSLDSVEFGFVAFETNNIPTVEVRVRNLMTEPLSDVSVFFDVVQMRDPSLCFRSRQLSNATLNPSESREVSLELGSADFFKVLWRGDPVRRDLIAVRDQSFMGDRWFNIAATLLFRGADGLLHSRTASIPFGF